MAIVLMSLNNDFVVREVSKSQIEEAKKIRSHRDSLYPNLYSENDTDIRWVGDLGEIVINELLSMCSEDGTIWHRDDVAGKPDFTFFDIDIDVKTVKRSVPIKPEYGAQISAKHKKTKMDYIVFCCYLTKENRMTVLGVIQKERFMSIARFYGPGDVVHESYSIRKGHEIYSVPIYELIPFRDFVRDILYKNRIVSKKH